MAYIYRTVLDLKNRARRIAREEQLPRHAALDEAARRAGFQNFAHALKLLPAEPVTTVRFPVEIVQRWFDREARQRGAARTAIMLATPLAQLVKPSHLAGNLGACRIEGSATVISDGRARDARDSVGDVGKVARTLQFMDATGLKPSRARRCYPKGDWQNRPPIADHDNCWFDPVDKVHVLATEPYPGRAQSHDAQQRAWEQKHGWTTVRVNWGSVYGHGTELYLLCPAAYAPALRAKIALLEASPSAVRDEDLDAGQAQRAA